MTDRTPILLDPVEAEAMKERRRRRLDLVSIPALRLIGLNGLAITALVHNLLVLEAFSTTAFLWYLLFIEVYCAVTWLLLYLFYDRSRFDLGMAVLIADYLPLALTVYISGGEQSWIYLLLLARAADQAATTFRRELLFSHLAVAVFLLLIAYLDIVEGRPIDWATELAKAGIIYIFALYVSLTARTADAQRARTRDAVRLARETLEDLESKSRELRRQSTRLATALGDAERASRAKSEFLSRVSHELRTPMNGILGFAQLLEMDDLTARQRVEVEEILTSGRRLLRIINDVLDIGRIESGKLAHVLEPVDLAAVLQEAIEDHREIAASRDISLPRSPPASCAQAVIADPARLRAVIHQLLGNAIRYNRASGAVDIRCARPSGGRVRVSIVDTGPGIRPDRLDDVFLPFHRLGQQDDTRDRVGLGLAISQANVHAMNGEIGVESEPGRGSTFWFELPASAAGVERAEPAPTRTVAPPTATGRATVLYIRPDAATSPVDEVLARQPGLTVLTVAEARAALGLAREHRPDLILLRTDLPDAAGIDVLRRLRDDPRTREIPVIVLSREALPGQSLRLTSAGARAHLTEPIDVPELVGLLDRILAGS